MIDNDGRASHVTKQSSGVADGAGTECFHTPGPWTWWTSCSWKRLKRDDRGITQNVLEPYVCSDGHPDLSVSREDMALIAAAPDLLMALKALELQALQSDVNDPANEWGREALDITRAAIAKATLSTDLSACPTENFLPSSLNNSLPQSLTSVSKKAGT